MFRRVIAPILRLLAFLGLLASPLLLAAIARAEARRGESLSPARASSRSVPSSSRTARTTAWPAVGASRRARRRRSSSARAGKVLVTSPGWGGSVAVKGWATRRRSSSSTTSRRRPRTSCGTRVSSSTRATGPSSRAAYLGEAVRREPANAEAWELLGHAGELLAQGARPAARTAARRPRSSSPASGASQVVPAGDGRSFRYDGEAYRRAIALAPPADLAERVRLRLLTACGSITDGRGAFDPKAASRREKDLGEFLASFPASTAPDVAPARARAPPDVARRERRAHGRRRGRSRPARRRHRVRLRGVRDRDRPCAPARGGPARRPPHEVASEARRVREARRLGGRPARAVRLEGRRDAPRRDAARRQGRDPAVPGRRRRPREPRVRRHGPEARVGRGARLGPPQDARPRPRPRARLRPGRSRRAGDPRLGRALAPRTPATPTATRRPSGFSPDGRLLLVVCEGFTADGHADPEAPRPLRRGGRPAARPRRPSVLRAGRRGLDAPRAGERPPQRIIGAHEENASKSKIGGCGARPQPSA